MDGSEEFSLVLGVHLGVDRDSRVEGRRVVHGGDVHVFDEENLVRPTGPRRDNTTGPVGRGGWAGDV